MLGIPPYIGFYKYIMIVGNSTYMYIYILINIYYNLLIFKYLYSSKILITPSKFIYLLLLFIPLEGIL